LIYTVHLKKIQKKYQWIRVQIILKVLLQKANSLQNEIENTLIILIVLQTKKRNLNLSDENDLEQIQFNFKNVKSNQLNTKRALLKN